MSAIMILQGSNIMNINPSANSHSLQPSWTAPYPTCDGFFSGQWHDMHPQYWTKFQVWEWLQQFVETNQLDASCIPFQEFDITGERLCSMTLQDFTQATGAVGHILYSNVQNLKWHDPGPITPWKEDTFLYESSYDDLYDVKAFSRSQLSTSAANHYNAAYAESDVKKSQDHPQRASVKKHNPRGTHLWEFIRDILLTPEKNPGLIRWEDRSEGVFRFLKSEAVAQLWGKKKNNSSMTYEKLSRAMRYYYKREILERVDGRRLVYKFGKNARGWKENDS
ncbi:ETS homologous factor isoform X3 [Ranitomeya variabilis]|uniref:ETS homologous factor isoform X3 n=1 Tax=Ranitomeya variabilis TaxID=490064 RepID=UPI004055F7DB